MSAAITQHSHYVGHVHIPNKYSRVKADGLRLAKQALPCLSRKSLTAHWMGESCCEQIHGLKTCVSF